MNERIRQLVAEAFFDETADESDTKIYKLNDAQMQKFAELIVAECEEVVRWAISVDSTIERVPVLIREHFRVDFGVES